MALVRVEVRPGVVLMLTPKHAARFPVALHRARQRDVQTKPLVPETKDETPKPRAKRPAKQAEDEDDEQP